MATLTTGMDRMSCPANEAFEEVGRLQREQGKGEVRFSFAPHGFRLR